ncbi:hypothetical protein JCM18904_5177 [Vibrio sp. JCM 18904]|nr:hypothetical protein JCM18904_5177 [Vibrio sp. JCM 18904]
MKANHLVLADAFDSLVIGKPEKRAQFDATLAALSDSQKEAFKKEHHDKNRSSLKDIVSFAHKYAENYTNKNRGKPMQFKQLTKGDVVYVRRTVNVNSGWCTRTLGTF